MFNVFDNMSVQLCKMWCKSNIEDIYNDNAICNHIPVF